MKQQISKTLLAEQLNRAIGTNSGLTGLNILIYGWTRKDPQLRTNISHRSWLYGYEVKELSAYAGYDLRPQNDNSICAAD